jgi:hypothetical protein
MSGWRGSGHTTIVDYQELLTEVHLCGKAEDLKPLADCGRFPTDRTGFHVADVRPNSTTGLR